MHIIYIYIYIYIYIVHIITTEIPVADSQDTIYSKP